VRDGATAVTSRSHTRKWTARCRAGSSAKATSGGARTIARAVFVANEIVAAHQQYLGYGGLGFLLGDGALTPGPEKIFEGFYSAHLWRGCFASCDFQHINNPGYNKARGPVFVPGLRFHVEF